MKLSKKELKIAQEIDQLIYSGKQLTHDEKIHIYENFYPAYYSSISEASAFFTPYDLALDFNLQVKGSRIIDLCSGIGLLSFVNYHYQRYLHDNEIGVVCVERNQKFVEIGKILFPEAQWICADALDQNTYTDLGKFDMVISNPPFGKVKTTTDTTWLKYKGSEFEYRIIEIASRLSNNGSFIIPSGSVHFTMTNSGFIDREKRQKQIKFENESGIELVPNMGIPCDIYVDQWKGTKVQTEIVLIDLDDFPRDH